MKITKNMKIAGATGLTLFSLVASFTAASAWFARDNGEVNPYGMMVKADNTSTSFVSVEVHKCIPDQCTSTTLSFSSEIAMYMEDGVAPNKSLVIDDYGDLNKSQPVLLLFNLSEGATVGSISISAKTNSTSSWLPAISASNVNKYPLSNAVYFRSNAFSRTGTGFLYSSIAVSDLAQEEEFAKFTATTTDGQTTYIYKQYNQNITVFDGSLYKNSSDVLAPNTVVTHIAVVLDYYLPAVQAVQTHATGDPYVMGGTITNPSTGQETTIPGNGNRLGFSCDWSMHIS